MNILGIPVEGVTMDEAVHRVADFVAERDRPHMVVTANSEMIIAANYDPLLGHILERADLVVPDGIGVVLASRIHGQPFPQRIPGVDLMYQLLQHGHREGWKFYLLGAAPGVAEQAAAAIAESFPGIQIVGCRDGFFSRDDEEALLKDLRSSGADILFLAMGVPRQEKWAAAHLGSLGIPVAMGVGGSFNIWAGVDRRAPKWMQSVGLEWLYRLLRQPQRWKRAGALPQFALLVLWERIRGRGGTRK